MKMRIFTMNILSELDYNYTIEINDHSQSSLIAFNPYEKRLTFLDNSLLTDYLKTNEYQLRKMLHNKRKDTYYIGFSLKFSLRDEKDVAGFNDRNRIVVLDHRSKETKSYVLDKGEDMILKVYTDASFLDYKKFGVCVFIIENPDGNYTLHKAKVFEDGSSQAELRSVIKALELLKDVKKIRIITDSQYVRKGLTEWVPNWKLNNWKTVNGEPVKNINNWLEFEKACQGKYLEFAWIKGHSNHFEHSLCDLYARNLLKEIKE